MVLKIYVLYGICTGASAAFLIPNIIQLGGTQTDIALMRLVATVASLLLSVPTGWLADRYGHKKMTLLGFLTLLLGFIAPAIHVGVGGLMVAGGMIAAADAIVLGALQLWTQDEDPKVANLDSVERLKIFDQRQRYGMIAGAVGIPLILGWVGISDLRGSWLILLLASVALLIVGLGTGSNRNKSGSESLGDRLSARYNLGALEAYSKKSGKLVYLASLALFVVGFSEEISTNVFWPKISTVIDLSVPLNKGLTMASTSLARVLGMTIFFALARSRKQVNNPILPGLAVLGSSLFFLLFAFTNGVAATYLVWTLRVVTIVLYFPTYQALVLAHAPDSFKATWFSAAAMIMGFGSVAASILLAHFQPDFGSPGSICLGAGSAALGGVIWIGVGKVQSKVARS